MHLTIQTILPWVMSIGTIATILLAGEKKRVAWLVGLLNQCLWASFIVMTGNWGLAPLTVAMTIVYARNLRKWKKGGKVTISGDIERGDGEKAERLKALGLDWKTAAIERLQEDLRRPVIGPVLHEILKKDGKCSIHFREQCCDGIIHNNGGEKWQKNTQ